MSQWLEKLKNKLIFFYFKFKKIVITLLFLLVSCKFSFEKKVLTEPNVEKRKVTGISFINYEEGINEGYYNEVLEFLEKNKEKIGDNPSLKFAFGKILLSKFLLEESEKFFQDVLKKTSSAMPIYGKTLWNYSLIYYFKNEFFTSYELMERAHNSGYQADEGFRNFLKKSPKKLYEFEESFFKKNFEYSKVKIPFIKVKINDKTEEKAVIDTGASLSFISYSFAEKNGIEISKETKSKGFGFHGKIIPVWLNYLNSLEIDGFKVKNIPIMIFRDEDLTFGDLKISLGIGFHFLKEGVLKIDYKKKEISFNVLKRKENKKGNLIILGLRAGVEVTINGYGFYNFILDTGSEGTYITNFGAKKAILSEKLNFFDVITRGLGKAKVEYKKIEDATIGISGYKIWYSNITSKREQSPYIDGILGNDFLENFIVEMDFSKNNLKIYL